MRIQWGSPTRRSILASGVALLGGCLAGEPEEDVDADDTQSDDRGEDDEENADEPTPLHHDPDEEAERSEVEPRYRGVYIDTGHPIEEFEDLEPWRSEGGSITSDTEYRFSGTQSLSYNGPSGSVIGEYAEAPLDLREADLSVAAVFPRSVGRAEPFFVYADAPDPENHVVWRGYHSGARAWQRYDLTPYRVVGDPDLADVRRLEFQGPQPIHGDTEFNLDDLRAHPKPDRGKVIFLLYGALAKHFEEYRHVLIEHGFPGVVAVHEDLVWEDNSSQMSEREVRRLYDNGWDVCATTTDQPWSMRVDEFDQRLRRMHEWFADRHIERGTNVFMYPYGNYRGRHLDVLADHFDLSFVGSGTHTNYDLTNPMTLPRFDASLGVERAKEVVDRAAAHRSVGILRFTDGYSRREFEDLVRYVAEYQDRIDVMSASDLAAEAWSGN